MSRRGKADVWRPGAPAEPAPPAPADSPGPPDVPPRTSRRRLWLGAGVVLVLALIAGAVWFTLRSDDDARSVDGYRMVYPTCTADSAPDARCCPADRASAPRTSFCPDMASFDPTPYTVDHGQAQYGCDDFASQADAQAVLRAGPDDVNGLSYDGDGIACRGWFPPTDFEPVTAAIQKCTKQSNRSAHCPDAKGFDPSHFVRGSLLGVPAYHCSDFVSQADAQAVLRFAPTDPNQLDPDKTGIACPDLPDPRDETPVLRLAPGEG